MIKAIETHWKGYRFRSRLEARWAVFFEELGLQWDYEPEGFVLSDGSTYLPDFFIHGNGGRGPYIEIKGSRPTENEILKMHEICVGLEVYGAIFWGPFSKSNWISFHKEIGMFDLQHLENPGIGESGINPFCGYSNEKTAQAMIAARSARFEHGEKPRVLS